VIAVAFSGGGGTVVTGSRMRTIVGTFRDCCCSTIGMSLGIGRRRGFCSAALVLTSGGLVTEITFIGIAGNEVVVVIVVVFFTTVQVPPIFDTTALDIKTPSLLVDTDGAVLFVSVMNSTTPSSFVVSYVTICKT